MGLMTSSGRRWVWYSGRPSLDFVNTRRNRRPAGGSRAEYLQGPDDFAAWLHAAGLAAAAGPVAGHPVRAVSGPCGQPGGRRQA